jgi:hypothetical protein
VAAFAAAGGVKRYHQSSIVFVVVVLRRRRKVLRLERYWLLPLLARVRVLVPVAATVVAEMEATLAALAIGDHRPTTGVHVSAPAASLNLLSIKNIK